MNLPSYKPLNKVTYSTIAGIVTALVFWALRRYAGIEIDVEGTTLITSLVVAIVAGTVGYATPLADSEVKQIVQAPDAPVQHKKTHPVVSVKSGE